jgi:hypothetical protein
MGILMSDKMPNKGSEKLSYYLEAKKETLDNEYFLIMSFFIVSVKR